ncbi:hypothetical protein CDCA_CDCA01G0397 [Cyanidium caldarium]|uniref:Uncharacterized protein n=1 Tax=Cyanidium caldarium TaxID=2771 RepID=A0AAV9IPU8_CYACA|nr:hypothetical protein CDCA_CDCA01G0397 [Cyanidium caldarium]
MAGSSTSEAAVSAPPSINEANQVLPTVLEDALLATACYVEWQASRSTISTQLASENQWVLPPALADCLWSAHTGCEPALYAPVRQLLREDPETLGAELARVAAAAVDPPPSPLLAAEVVSSANTTPTLPRSSRLLRILYHFYRRRVDASTADPSTVDANGGPVPAAAIQAVRTVLTRQDRRTLLPVLLHNLQQQAQWTSAGNEALIKCFHELGGVVYVQIGFTHSVAAGAVVPVPPTAESLGDITALVRIQRHAPAALDASVPPAAWPSTPSAADVATVRLPASLRRLYQTDVRVRDALDTVGMDAVARLAGWRLDAAPGARRKLDGPQTAMQRGLVGRVLLPEAGTEGEVDSGAPAAEWQIATLRLSGGAAEVPYRPSAVLSGENGAVAIPSERRAGLIEEMD